MDVVKTIEERRAYRSLAPVEIDRKLIEELARCASLSPSCYNNQPWRFDFVTGGTLERMRAVLSRGNEWARAASMIVAVHAAAEQDCRIKEREYYLFDAGLATALLVLRATDLGLVAHPIAGYDEEKTRAILDIPPEERIITLVIVGRRAEEISPDLSQQQAQAERERPQRHPFERFARVFT